MKMITAIYSYILYSIFHIYDKVIQWKHTEVCAGHQPAVGDSAGGAADEKQIKPCCWNAADHRIACNRRMFCRKE